MRPFQGFAERRIVARSALLDAVVAASQRHGATAVHLLGSLGRQAADAFSDIDAWLTFPGETIDAAVRDRFDLYRDAGDLLLTHEAVSNRPRGGVYTLALYQTATGPLQVDWYLAPQRTSRVAHQAAVVFERVPVPRGTWLLDSEAKQEESLAERISWLTCMLYIAVKAIVRGGDPTILTSLAEAYRDVGKIYRLGEMPVTDPATLTDVGAMLHQLAPFADDAQRRALRAVADFATSIC